MQEQLPMQERKLPPTNAVIVVSVLLNSGVIESQLTATVVASVAAPAAINASPSGMLIPVNAITAPSASIPPDTMAVILDTAP